MAKINPALRQPTSDDLVAELLDFLHRKFYQAHPIAFAKDRPRLLKWVVLYPATWLNKRGVTVPSARYRQIFMAVFLDALRFGSSNKVDYLPAYLGKVIQSHFDHHGDEIYEEAKSMRNLTENAVVVAGRAVQTAPDPVRTLADAARLLKPKPRPSKRPAKAQLDLL